MAEGERKWYQKKRYTLSIAVLGIIVIAGLNNNTPSQIQSSNYAATAVQTQPAPKVPVYNPLPQTSTQQGQTNDLSNNNYYTNVSGNTVHSPAYSENGSVPSGASARCGDGTYSFSQHRSGTCSHHGGVSSWLY